VWENVVEMPVITPPTWTTNATLALHYTFGTDDTNTAIINRANPGTWNGARVNDGGGAGLATTNGISNFYTGTNTGTSGTGAPGYINIPSAAGAIITGQDGYTVASYVYIDQANEYSGNGFFLWAFSTLESAGGTGHVSWFRATDMRHVMSRAGWGGGTTGESGVSVGMHVPRQRWTHVLYRHHGTTGTIYVDGIARASATLNHRSNQLTQPTFNWVGRPCFANDNYVPRTRYHDFRMYRGAISDQQIIDLGIPARLAEMNGN